MKIDDLDARKVRAAIFIASRSNSLPLRPLEEMLTPEERARRSRRKPRGKQAG